MKNNPEKLIEAYGEVQTLITPSGHEITIRMQNGNDDDIISNAVGVEDGTATNKFIAGIVVHTDMTENGKFNLDDARNLKLCDKYFILIASRIFSLGQNLHFTFTWPDKVEAEYDEDLGLFIWDYWNEDKPFPIPGDPEYFKNRIPPHPFGKDATRIFKTRTGKELRYTFMNGHGERYAMKVGLENQSINTELFGRNMEQKIGDAWVPIQTFKPFTSLDMVDIRTEIETNDPEIGLATEIPHPRTKEILEYPIIASTDFFFPRGI